MEEPYQLLALKNGFGSVFRCGDGCLHLSVGRIAIAMNVEEYYELVDVINTSAANFELGRHQGPPEAGNLLPTPKSTAFCEEQIRRARLSGGR